MSTGVVIGLVVAVVLAVLFVVWLVRSGRRERAIGAELDAAQRRADHGGVDPQEAGRERLTHALREDTAAREALRRMAPREARSTTGAGRPVRRRPFADDDAAGPVDSGVDLFNPPRTSVFPAPAAADPAPSPASSDGPGAHSSSGHGGGSHHSSHDYGGYSGGGYDSGGGGGYSGGSD